MGSPGVLSGEEAVEWWRVQRDVTTALTQPGASLAGLVKQVTQSAPTNEQAAKFKLCVLMHAGMNNEAIQALREIKALCPMLPSHEVVSIYSDAGARLQAWDVAQATVELFAENINTEWLLQYGLLKHFLDSGWSVERVDAWLASRPPGVGGFWVKERLRFNVQQGRGAALEKELADRVRANPKDAPGAIGFLDAMVYAHVAGEGAGDLGWMAETIKPELATDAEALASRLARLKNEKTAIAFYQQAVRIPLTGGEIHRLSSMSQLVRPAAGTRAVFAASTREALAECLLKTGQVEEARKWMLEASEIREKNHLGRNPMLAGRVQAASGQRAAEAQIKTEEKVSSDDPKYWQERARYYRGRKESGPEEEALKKGLALTTPRPPSTRRAKGYSDPRSSLLGDYVRFLAREKREEEAVSLLKKEIAESPAASESSERAANLLAFEFPKHAGADDPALWTWLEKRPKWDYTEERLLWRMLENADRQNLDPYLTRAEKIASDGDLSRANTLGWIENRMRFAQRSIPLLEHVVEKAQDKGLKDGASFTLFESYLATGDWKRAEGIFPNASHRLTLSELTGCYSGIAVAAAKAGAKADAIRIWTRVANLDLSATGAVQQLADAGLRDELVSLYRDMQKAIPSSEIPAKMLRMLRAQGTTMP
jgi:tetratricopeptide (TPR) repeat protein